MDGQGGLVALFGLGVVPPLLGDDAELVDTCGGGGGSGRSQVRVSVWRSSSQVQAPQVCSCWQI